MEKYFLSLIITNIICVFFHCDVRKFDSSNRFESPLKNFHNVQNKFAECSMIYFISITCYCNYIDHPLITGELEGKVISYISFIFLKRIIN